MVLEKVRSYPTPDYPTAKEFHELEKLTQYMPRRWRTDRQLERVLLFITLTGLGAPEKDNAPQASLAGDDQLCHKQCTEVDAYHFLQTYSDLSTGRPSMLPDITTMPDWHSPEDWDRAVEEYRMAHPTLCELSQREALQLLADWLR